MTNNDDLALKLKKEIALANMCGIHPALSTLTVDEISSLLAERDADKRQIAEQQEHITSLEEGVNILLAQYDQLAAAIGWTTEKALAGEGNQEQYAEAMVKRLAELEARTVSVKLPPKVDYSNVPFAAHTWNSCIDEVAKRLAAAGINLEVGE